MVTSSMRRSSRIAAIAAGAFLLSAATIKAQTVVETSSEIWICTCRTRR